MSEYRDKIAKISVENENYRGENWDSAFALGSEADDVIAALTSEFAAANEVETDLNNTIGFMQQGLDDWATKINWYYIENKSLREAMAQMDFQSQCSWCENNMAIQAKTLKGEQA